MYTLIEDFKKEGFTISKGISFKKNYTINETHLTMGDIKIPLSILEETEEKIFKKTKKTTKPIENVVQSTNDLARISNRPDLLK